MSLLVVGLGNPGKEYEHTRHNVGFFLLDAIAQDFGMTFRTSPAHRAEIAEGNVDGEKILLAKPLTYMNLSGEAVAAIAKQFRLEPKDIVVLYDEAALPFGTIRTRIDGSAGGHNGIKSLIEHLKTETFGRIRIGIGEAPDDRPLEDWVLARFSKEEQEHLKKISLSALTLIKERIEKGMLTEHTINIL